MVNEGTNCWDSPCWPVLWKTCTTNKAGWKQEKELARGYSLRDRVGNCTQCKHKGGTIRLKVPEKQVIPGEKPLLQQVGSPGKTVEGTLPPSGAHSPPALISQPSERRIFSTCLQSRGSGWSVKKPNVTSSLSVWRCARSRMSPVLLLTPKKVKCVEGFFGL